MSGDMGRLSPRLRVSEFIRYFIEMTGYMLVSLTKDDGDLIESGVDRFMKLADSFDMDGGKSVDDFISYINELQKADAKQNIAAGGGDDKVRIMTIHASKGVQSKIVIIPDISRENRNPHGNVMFAKGCPPGVKVKPTGSDMLVDTTEFLALKDLKEAENQAEYKRCLYVAATRAEDYLLFTGFIKFKNEKKDNETDIANPKNWMNAFKSVFGMLSPADIPRGAREIEKDIRFITDSGDKTEKVRSVVDFPADFDVADEQAAEEAFIVKYADNIKGFRRVDAPAAESMQPMEEAFMKAEKRRKPDYTVTMLNSFKTCEMLYYYKYIYGIPEYGFLPGGDRFTRESQAALDPAEIGNIVHKVLEEWSDYRVGYEPHLRSVLSEWNRLSLSDQTMSEFRGLLDSFTGSGVYDRLKAADDIKREITYITWLDGRRITSKIDCLYRYGGKWRVLDYKTEHVADIDESVGKYRFQLQIYGLAAALSLGLRQVTAELYFLRADKLVSFDIDIDAVRSELSGMVRRIESRGSANQEKAACDCKYCERCGYNAICEVKGACS